MERLFNLLSSIPDINAGGCGIAAYAIAEFFRSKGCEANIVYLYSSYDFERYFSNGRFMDGQTERATSCTHAVVKVYKECGYELYDSDGLFNNECKYEYSQEMTDDAVVASINNIDQWNSMFDRDHIQSIEEELSIDIPAV